MVERDPVLLISDLFVLPAQVVLVLPVLSSSFVTGDLVLDGRLNARSPGGRSEGLRALFKSRAGKKVQEWQLPEYRQCRRRLYTRLPQQSANQIGPT